MLQAKEDGPCRSNSSDKGLTSHAGVLHERLNQSYNARASIDATHRASQQQSSRGSYLPKEKTMQHTFQTDFIGDARTCADFYNGLAFILEGDPGNAEEGFRFLAELFGNVLKHEGSNGFIALAHTAVGQVAGLYSLHDDYHKKIWPRQKAMCDLIRRVAEADISAEAIDAIFPVQKDSEVAA